MEASTPDRIRDFVACKRWAVVGVSNDHAKFGRKIFEAMRSAGYDVVPIHLSLTKLDDGTPVFQRLGDLPTPVEVVDLVVPPAATRGVVQDCIDHGVSRVWFQPGTEDPVALELAAANGIATIAHGPCAMVEVR